MNECEIDESSDVEMVPIEEERPRDTVAPLRTDLQAQITDNSDKTVGIFTTGINIFSEEERLKMEERAKRFGLTEKSEDALSNREEDLYSSMGIMDDGENAKSVRLNVIHMRGTEEMSTKDVFKYFQDYAPQSIEWVNDVSCNVVWFDNLSAARAMLGLSKRIQGSVKRYSDATRDLDKDSVSKEEMIDGQNESVGVGDDEKMENCIHIKDIDYPLPPGIWRKGIDYPKSKGIYLRFATRMDRKQANAEKMSDYYKKHGNPNFGGIKGILTESRKRLYKQTRQSKRKMTTEDKDRNQAKNPWGALSETWGLNDIVEDDFLPKSDQARDQGRSVKERLGSKCTDKEPTRAEESDESVSSSDSEENWCKRSKVLRMRMHADDEEEKQQKRRARLRYQMFLNNLNNSDDLRLRLGRPKTKTQYRDPIQVVVTNTNVMKSSSLKRDNAEIIQGQSRPNTKEVQSTEREEGEWQESENEDDHEEENEIEWRRTMQEEVAEEQRGTEEEEGEEDEDEDEEEEGEHRENDKDNDLPAKEVQGPKGSVIKVVSPKPRVASTVWARLNHVKSEVSDSYLKNRKLSGSRDLRNTLKTGDLRSRIGNHTRGRSPLRIEVKNDKYTKDASDGE